VSDVAAGAWSLLLAIAAGGCDAPTTEPTSESTQVTSRRADAPEDYAAAGPKKGQILGGERVARTVQWPAADQLDAPTRERLSSAAVSALGRAPLPVLVPAEGVERGQLFVGESWYAFSTEIEGTSVSVQGSAEAKVHPHIRKADPTQTVRGRGGFVSQNESIWSVSWIENGVAYSLELQCDDPRAAACADPNRAVELAQSMVFVGGGEDR
jgi:hypothetical protein